MISVEIEGASSNEFTELTISSSTGKTFWEVPFCSMFLLYGFQVCDIKHTFPALSAVYLFLFFEWMKLRVLNVRSVAAEVHGAVSIPTTILLNFVVAQILFNNVQGDTSSSTQNL